MFTQLKSLFETPKPVEDKPDELRLAVAVLLVEAAHMDDRFGPHEREVIGRLLTEKFDLSESETDELLSLSQETVARAAQLHPYTRTCFTQMDEEERLHIVEMLWEVAYADGKLDPEEDLLIRKIAGLIAIEDRDRIHARQRVLARRTRGN
jgi:uncharacterized tellurite resistance protein B-like protein